jgi:hypothetical protein
MFVVKIIQMSKVLKIHSTVCELLRTVDTDLIGFPLDEIGPKYGHFYVHVTVLCNKFLYNKTNQMH